MIYGQLTVLETFEKFNPRKDRVGQLSRVNWYSVQCSCGSKPFHLTHRALTKGAQMCHSCSHSGRKNSNGAHGESGPKARGVRNKTTPEYRAWKSIKTRCYNHRYKQYEGYGGRGVKVCERWFNSYEAFLADMGRRPSPKHSINRKQNDGHYCPENCEWADDRAQRRNKRSSVMIEINGESKNVSDWLIILGVPEGTYYWRKRKGYSTIEALGITPKC
jgi:hypothetical protein